MQRGMVYSGSGEVVPISAVVPTSAVVGGYVGGVGGNSHGRREVDLLPARSGFCSEGGSSQQGPRAAPQVAHMRAGVGSALIESNTSNITVHVRTERNSQFYGRVWTGVNICRSSRCRPNCTGTRLRSRRQRNAYAGNLQIAAVINGPTLDAGDSAIRECGAITPVLPTDCGMPGLSSVQRDLHRGNHTAPEVHGSTRNSYRRAYRDRAP